MIVLKIGKFLSRKFNPFLTRDRKIYLKTGNYVLDVDKNIIISQIKGKSSQIHGEIITECYLNNKLFLLDEFYFSRL